MAQGSTLYRFSIDLSDVDHAVYETFSIRVAMHSSESSAFLLTRVIAFCLNYHRDLEFSPGLSAPDEPAIRLPGTHGSIAKWIDIGNPSARRLHKASKASQEVLVYTYKNPELLKKELVEEKVHRVKEIKIYSLDQSFLSAIEQDLKRDNDWTIIYNDSELIISNDEKTWMTRVERHLI